MSLLLLFNDANQVYYQQNFHPGASTMRTNPSYYQENFKPRFKQSG
jgi:hypothetical protein